MFLMYLLICSCIVIVLLFLILRLSFKGKKNKKNSDTTELPPEQEQAPSTPDEWVNIDIAPPEKVDLETPDKIDLEVPEEVEIIKTSPPPQVLFSTKIKPVNYENNEGLINWKRKKRNIFFKYISKPKYGKAHEVMKQRASEMKQNPTYSESLFKEYLVSNHIRFWTQVIVYCQHAYILDFYLPDYHIAIEIDGGYHYQQVEKDKSRDKDLMNYFGIKTFRFSAKSIEEYIFESRLNNILEKELI